MFLLLLAVPALLVVVLGYVIGHGLWSWVAGMVDAVAGTSLAAGAGTAGWVTGVVTFAGAVRCAMTLRRRGPPSDR